MDLSSFDETHAAVGAAGLVLCFLAWSVRGAFARRAEKKHQSQLLEAKRSIPQLETGVRSRELQIERLREETTDLSEQIGELRRELAVSEKALDQRERDSKRLGSELAAIKGTAAGGGTLADGFAEMEVSTAEPASEETVPVSIYERLRQTLLEREEELVRLKAGAPTVETSTVGVSESRVSELEADNENLKAELASYRATHEHLEGELQELRERSEMVAELAKKRSNRNLELKASSSELQEQLPLLQQRIESLEGTVAEREASIGRLLRDSEDLKAKLKGERATIGRLETELKAARSALTEVQTDSEQTRDQLRAVQAQARESDGRVNAQKQEMVVLCQSLEQFKAEAGKQGDMVTALEARVRAEAERRSAAEVEAHTARERLQAAHKELDELKHLQQPLQAEHQERAARVEALERQVQGLQHELSESRQAQVAAAPAVVPSAVRDEMSRTIADLEADLAVREKWLLKMKASVRDRDEQIRQLEGRLALKPAADPAADPAPPAAPAPAIATDTPAMAGDAPAMATDANVTAPPGEYWQKPAVDAPVPPPAPGAG